jgi:hypothetical protein
MVFNQRVSVCVIDTVSMAAIRHECVSFKTPKHKVKGRGYTHARESKSQALAVRGLKKRGTLHELHAPR